jgi:hypothetical protein
MAKAKSKGKNNPPVKKRAAAPVKTAGAADAAAFSKGDRAQVVAGDSGWGNQKGRVMSVSGGKVTLALDGARLPEICVPAADLRKLPALPARA